MNDAMNNNSYSMISKIFLIALIGVVISRQLGESEVTIAFGNFMSQYGRQYKTIEETIMRYNIFAENYRFIDQFNEEGHEHTLAINTFADLTPEEFKQRYLNKFPQGLSFDNPCKLAHKSNGHEAVVDWRAKNAVAPVKNQGNCGSCWAFSTVGALEGLHAITKGSLVQFSEQELVDCTRGYGNEGCNGGWMSWAFEYVHDKGISTEKDYPYEGRDRTCRKKAVAFQIAGCVNVTSEDNDMLLEAVNNNPVAVAVRANNREFMYYRSGIIKSGCGGPKAELDHGITLVGAGIENGVNFWIVKNSWGSSWGEHGYVRIKRDSDKAPSMCGIAMEACYPQ
jgi:C1A family cysteine protease